MTDIDLVNFCKKKLKEKTVYMWGCFGQNLSESLISQKVKQYPNYYSKERQKKLKSLVSKKYKACDCVGLLKWFLWTNGGKTETITYNSKTDLGASGWLERAKVKGNISTLPEKVGLGLWMDGHFGIYIGSGKAIECTLSKYGDGVVETTVKGRGWEKWLEIPDISYTETKIETKTETKTTYKTMTVTPSVGLSYHNQAKWNSNSIVGCWKKGTKVKVLNGSEYKYGSYTGCKVLYNNKYVYCAKNYLK